MNISRGIVKKALKIVVYGPEGIGKSTQASQFPDPLFIDTEGSTNQLDVKRFDAPSSWTMLLAQIDYVKSNPDICKTLIIDTIDWAQKLCIDKVVADHEGWKSIEDAGYGKGYVYVYEEFGKLLNALSDLIEKDINVVLIAHAAMRKFELPDELGAYDRWEMKLVGSTKCNSIEMVKEWADVVLFANYKTHTVATDKDGKKKKALGGGQRVMYTSHHPCWDAKNRFNLPEELPFEFSKIAHILPNFDQKTQKTDQKTEKTKPSYVEHPGVKLPPTIGSETESAKSKEELAKEEKTDQPVVSDAGKQMTLPTEMMVSDKIPKALRDLMIANNVNDWDIQGVVASRGYFPSDMPIENYPEDFINGVLVGAWDQVYKMIQDIKEKEEIPFN